MYTGDSINVASFILSFKDKFSKAEAQQSNPMLTILNAHISLLQHTVGLPLKRVLCFSIHVVKGTKITFSPVKLFWSLIWRCQTKMEKWWLGWHVFHCLPVVMHFNTASGSLTIMCVPRQVPNTFLHYKDKVT